MATNTYNITIPAHSEKNSPYVGSWIPSGSSTKKQYRSFMEYNISVTDTEVTATIYSGVHINSTVDATFSHTLVATGYSKSTGSTETVYEGNTTKTVFKSKKYTWARTTEDKDVSITAGTYCTKSKWSGRSWTYVTINFTVPARHHFPINFDSTEGEGEIESIIKFFNINETLPMEVPTRDTFSFAEWNTERDEDGKGVGRSLFPGSLITDNTGMVDEGLETERTDLYAVWQPENPPTCDNSGLRDDSDFATYTKYFSEISTDISNIEICEGRTIDSIVLNVGNDSSAPLTDEGTLTVTPSESGEQVVTVVIEDSDGAKTSYPLGTINVAIPKWNKTVSYTTDTPDIDADNKAVMTVEVYNYTLSEWEEITNRYEISGVNGDWSFNIVLTEDYVDEPTADEPNSQVRSTFNHSVFSEKEYRKAFYQTTRNANYSNGIANSVFVSGCSATNYSSRVWWSYPNNPLYFPDTSYVEVGSNDTSVQGLIKVGDYLGAIKQSKTTDTAIYLLYPTSFDDDTTYAVKQGVQGVGALAKYSFNILGDETLFLSPNGVMAIVPSADDEHKVQNRSFFVDGKLLKEESLESAYSFVYDGKYWLAVNGNCYVLDGNQRNSWGNDRTNLVYEAYYLENIPATCFVKYHNELWFSDMEAVYRLTDGYTDDGVPVCAEWSTLFDDDGSVHYLKTMQKKGDVVSILPCGETSVDVYVRRDDKPLEKVGTITSEDDIPKEFMVNKKFKKYSRLQFILRSELACGFGVDKIVKNYSIGNYRKR